MQECKYQESLYHEHELQYRLISISCPNRATPLLFASLPNVPPLSVDNRRSFHSRKHQKRASAHLI